MLVYLFLVVISSCSHRSLMTDRLMSGYGFRGDVGGTAQGENVMSCATQAMRVWCCHLDHDCLMKDTGILFLTPIRSDDAGPRADPPLFVLSESPESQILWSCVVGKGSGSAVGRVGLWEGIG